MKNKKWMVFLMACCFSFATFFFLPPSWADDPSSLDDLVDYYTEEEEWDLDSEPPTIDDPWEGYNRAMFKFNNGFFKYVLKPISKGYDFLVPKMVQSSLDNLYTNARMPVRFFNCLFQGKIKGASVSMGRFVINTVTGLGGFMDPARQHFKWPLQDEDFGQTLGHYGMGSGIYIVWPFLGPSSVRGGLGMIGDSALNPLTWLFIYDVRPTAALRGASGLGGINSFSYNIRENYENLLDSAIDPYIAIQDAYIQSRTKKIRE